MSTEEEVAQPSAAELASMSRRELNELGARLDGVELVEYGPRYEPGSPADRRAERAVAKWFVLAGLFGIAFLVVFVAMPDGYQPPTSPGQSLYAWFTPLLGITLGGAILLAGIGVISLARNITPHEVAVQQRHVGLSAELDRRTLGAEVTDAVEATGIKRRGLIKGSIAVAGVGLGIAALVPIIGGLIKNPWAQGADSELWVTSWRPVNGKKVRLTHIDGTPVRPEDMAAGGLLTVFPGVPGGATAADSAVMLFRLRPDQRVQIRTGQDGFNFGDYYAYSKVCTHVGCPVSLYEQQTGRVLCPCHQSQFDIFDGGRPVFGPATRPLPQLPIMLDDDGFFVARHDFIEAVGPGFWENGKTPPWGSHPNKES